MSIGTSDYINDELAAKLLEAHSRYIEERYERTNKEHAQTIRIYGVRSEDMIDGSDEIEVWEAKVVGDAHEALKEAGRQYAKENPFAKKGSLMPVALSMNTEAWQANVPKDKVDSFMKFREQFDRLEDMPKGMMEEVVVVSCMLFDKRAAMNVYTIEKDDSDKRIGFKRTLHKPVFDDRAEAKILTEFYAEYAKTVEESLSSK